LYFVLYTTVLESSFTMKVRGHLLLYTVIAAAGLTACRKPKIVDPCEGLTTMPVANFAIKEVLSDTAFYTDTIFQDNGAEFVALDEYQTVNWSVGDDPRNFTQKSFSLHFPNFLGSLNVKFTGTNKPNTVCFPADNGIYEGTKRLTVVKQVDKPIVVKSPLIGNYLGAYTDSPLDTFTVRIEYFDSLKYESQTTGSKNFYYVSNFPKGYVDSTSSYALAYPELRNGMFAEMGFKGLCFGHGAVINQGRAKGYLVTGDSIKIHLYQAPASRKLFLGRRK
jgi:hypothetical protein